MITTLATLTDDDQRFIQAMRDVVDERGPDFVYPDEWQRDEAGCRYVYDGRPACVIGAALARMGVPLDVLSFREGMDARHVIRHIGLAFSDRVVAAADEAQAFQDAGAPWGQVLGVFLTYVEHGVRR